LAKYLFCLSEVTLQTAVVQQTAETLAEDEMPVFDASLKIRELQAAKLPRYKVRLAKNFTARCNVLPSYKGHGRHPEYGELVRPLARTRRGKYIPTTPPDWKVHPDNPTFIVAAIYDPRYQEPWLLACPLQLSGAALRGLYRDRWPVEQVPLAAN
jgi:hypothetical protein